MGEKVVRCRAMASILYIPVFWCLLLTTIGQAFTSLLQWNGLVPTQADCTNVGMRTR